TKTSRSTVGTATEVYDYLRLLWARVGRTFCPVCGREMKPDSVESITDLVARVAPGTRFTIAFPLRLSSQVTHEVVDENLRAQGFVRVVADGETLHLDDVATRALDLTTVRDLLVVVDRLTVDPVTRSRLSDALGTAFREGDGDATVLFAEPVPSPLPESAERTVTRVNATERYECPNDGTRLPAPSPQLFSFNNPRGACETCNGFGAVLEYDEGLIVPNAQRSLREGAIDPWEKPRYEAERRTLVEFARREKIDPDAPWRELSRAAQTRVLHGSGRGFVGVFPFLRSKEEKRYKQYIRVFLRQYQTAQECPTCHGTKLKPEALAVRIDGATIADAAAMSVDRLVAWLDGVSLTDFERQVAAHVLDEARGRVQFLSDVGLGYLSLNRTTRTLSGGEAQRIGLANSLGARLVDTLYVLDEPSVGLHSRDMERLLRLLHRLRDGGNTVLVVEHDPEAIEAADYMVELGPGSGEQGGALVFAGPIARAGESPLTGQYLTGARTIPLPRERRPLGPRWLALTGAREHNLQGVDIRVPLGAMTVVTGVSGSGKSTLVHDVLYRALEERLHGAHSAKQHLGERVGAFDTLTGWEALDDVVLVDQSPIGRTPRSNPVTYVKAYDDIRRLFAEQPLARQRGYTPGTFSFNSEGGRCEACEGAGYVEVEMVFMADVYVPCDICGGTRFKPEVLEVTVRGKTIHDVLGMTVDEAIRFFPREEKLGQALWQLQQVGLGYLRLGQPATTLSGGEAQRVKIARELTASAKSKGRKLYVMDEPTTGLHLEDIRKLAAVFDRLVDAGHTLLLIEHNLDVVKLADWVIDIGPEAGDEGGQIVAMGRPEAIMAESRSHTGRFLQRVLKASVPAPETRDGGDVVTAPVEAKRTRARRRAVG
nr:excinuclease ABC subunit UvrA [Candidatus Eremiobacteraeota bacterium]